MGRVSSTQSGPYVQCPALAEGAGLSGQHLRAKSQTPSNFHLSQCLALAEGAGLSWQHLRAKSQIPPNFHFSGCLAPRTQLGLRLFI